LVDERGVGMLGNYVESMRAIRLVAPGSIVVNDTAISQLLGEPRFEWPGTSPPTWGSLDGIFSKVDRPRVWPRLGHLLFDAHDFGEPETRMFSAAKTARVYAEGAWVRLADSTRLLEPQRCVARATDVITSLENELRRIFEDILAGQSPSLPQSAAKRLSRLAAKFLRIGVFETVWPNQPAIARVLQREFELVATRRLTAQALLGWHLEVMGARGTDPWLRELGEHSAQRLAAVRMEPDFRLANLRNLVLETKWQG